MSTMTTEPTTATVLAIVARLYSLDHALFVQSTYPEALPLLAEGWTIDSALDHVQGTCDQVLCTGEHA